MEISVHHNTRSGVSVNCVDCHLPPEDQKARFLTRKAYHGFHDLYVYLTKDAEEIDWAEKRSMEAAKRFVYEDGCKKCHTNMFPSTLNELGSQSHLNIYAILKYFLFAMSSRMLVIIGEKLD